MYIYNINNNDFLKYHMLIGSIPDILIKKLQNSLANNTPYQPLIQNVIKSKSVNKLLYNMQLKNKKKSK